MVAPITTAFGDKNIGKMTEKIVRGIVRHYKTPKSKHHPYMGILTDPTDLKKHEINNLQQMLRDFPDGGKIEIVITLKGESKCAHGFVWMLTEPHTYERVPREKWLNPFLEEAD